MGGQDGEDAPAGEMPRLRPVRDMGAETSTHSGGEGVMELPEGWIAHDGGICPVHVDDFVTYKLRMGWVSDSPVEAGFLRWDWGRTPESASDPSLRRNDIIAYKLEPAP